jgi:indole-3-glycerol phosphate synthase
MSGLLELICAEKRAEVVRRMAIRSTRDMMAASRVAPPPRGFEARLREAQVSGRTGLIAEIKRASPSRGLIRADFDPPALARAFRDGGAACLSVLTQGPHFQGEDHHLRTARDAVDLPTLRKDFFVDPYQAIEARALGADCILLIMAALSDGQASEIEAAAREHGMDVLVEVHNEEELDHAAVLESRLIGINNRNLATLEVDLSTTERLAGRVPSGALTVSESGIESAADITRLRGAGVSCFLVGEALMRASNVAAATSALLASA